MIMTSRELFYFRKRLLELDDSQWSDVLYCLKSFNGGADYAVFPMFKIFKHSNKRFNFSIDYGFGNREYDILERLFINCEYSSWFRRLWCCFFKEFNIDETMWIIREFCKEACGDRIIMLSFDADELEREKERLCKKCIRNKTLNSWIAQQ